MITSFHEDMKETIHYDRSSFFPNQERGEARLRARSNSLRHFSFAVAVLYLQPVRGPNVSPNQKRWRSLQTVSSLRARTRVRHVLVREKIFADYAGLATHSKKAFQLLINCLAHACRGLTISVKKSNLNFMCQDTSSVPSISIAIGDLTLAVVEDFAYLGSIISSNLSVDAGLNKLIGKAAMAMAVSVQS